MSVQYFNSSCDCCCRAFHGTNPDRCDSCIESGRQPPPAMSKKIALWLFVLAAFLTTTFLLRNG